MLQKSENVIKSDRMMLNITYVHYTLLNWDNFRIRCFSYSVFQLILLFFIDWVKEMIYVLYIFIMVLLLVCLISERT